MSLIDFLNSCENKIDLYSDIDISFSRTGFGFGQLRFYQKDDIIYCDNECMTKDTVKKILAQMVDECVLLDTPTNNNEESNE